MLKSKGRKGDVSNILVGGSWAEKVLGTMSSLLMSRVTCCFITSIPFMIFGFECYLLTFHDEQTIQDPRVYVVRFLLIAATYCDCILRRLKENALLMSAEVTPSVAAVHQRPFPTHQSIPLWPREVLAERADVKFFALSVGHLAVTVLRNYHYRFFIRFALAPHLVLLIERFGILLRGERCHLYVERDGETIMVPAKYYRGAPFCDLRRL